MNNHPPRPIVCGTDFSEAAVKAANAAAAIALRLDAPLLLVHGVDEHGEIPASYWASMMGALRSQLHEEAGRVRRTGALVEEIMAGGTPDDGVASRAERADARFIVLASKGHGALARWTLGSVAERIAESAWVPTLILREATRIEDWARGGKPLRVFIGADFTEFSEAALGWAASLREIGPCEFTVGFVDLLASQRAERVASALTAAPLATEMHEMLNCDLRERASNYFQKETVDVRVLPTPGRVDTHLLEMATEARADLIVIGTHQWHGLNRLRHSSVSRRILQAAGTSVACVPSHHVVTASTPCLSRAHRVLVATDLSAHGGSAVLYAFSALQSGGTARLLHVAEPGEALDAKEARLRELIPAEAAGKGFKVEVEAVADRDAANAICAAADRLEADLICLGSRGPCKRAAALGETMLAVLARSTRPVLVVPQNHS